MKPQTLGAKMGHNFNLYAILLTLVVLTTGLRPRSTFQTESCVPDVLVSKDTLHLYFPVLEESLSVAEKANSLDTVLNIWYSRMLTALNEPILYNYEGDSEVVRFTWLRTFDNPVAIRVDKSQDNFRVTVKVLDGQGGYDPGNLVVNKTNRVSFRKWETLMTGLDSLNFWNLPSQIEWRGNDGSECILEYSSKNKYHFTTRWSPNFTNGYGSLCAFLIKLSGLDLKEQEMY